MCYSGTCPYEGRGGGCNLSHHYDAGRVPADAWCSDEEEADADMVEEPGDEDFRRINALTAEIEGRRVWKEKRKSTPCSAGEAA